MRRNAGNVPERAATIPRMPLSRSAEARTWGVSSSPWMAVSIRHSWRNSGPCKYSLFQTKLLTRCYSYNLAWNQWSRFAFNSANYFSDVILQRPKKSQDAVAWWDIATYNQANKFQRCLKIVKNKSPWHKGQSNVHLQTCLHTFDPSVVTRNCNAGDSQTKDTCNYNANAVMCECTGDLCNAANPSTLGNSAATLVLPLSLALFFAAKFAWFWGFEDERSNKGLVGVSALSFVR